VSPPSPGKLPPASALAIVLSEGIWHDPGNGKRFILGCLATIGAHSFPVTQPAVGVYIAITNGHGRVPFRIQVVDADEERELVWAYEGEIEFNDPRSIAELDFIFEDATFPEPDEYHVQVFAYGEFIVERRLSLVELSEE
jgi:hypothetical protein